jgi:hypothetical protein
MAADRSQLHDVIGDKPADLLSGPRGGKADDLKLIWGVGPKLEKMLNGAGIYHFEQMAKWTDRELAWVDSQLGDFAGRAVRDKWIEQAQKLSAGWRPSKEAGVSGNNKLPADVKRLKGSKPSLQGAAVVALVEIARYHSGHQYFQGPPRPMPDLKLIALDADDLNVISAHLQDAVVRVADMKYLPREKRFAAVVNRFDWDKALSGARRKGGERRRAGLRFERVLGAKIHGIDPKDSRATLALLAITFEKRADPDAADGHVTLTFSGGAAIRLEVECLEAEMKDLGAARAAKRTPDHPDSKS